MRAINRLFWISLWMLVSLNLQGERSPADLLKGDPVTEPSREIPAAEKEERPALDRQEDVNPMRTRRIRAHVVSISDEISVANEFILRRAVKEATREQVDALIVNMDTPGGRLDVTLEMMQMLDRFEGDTFTYVNPDAISAGAYISMVTETIYFAPKGVMGAAAVVGGGGEDIGESMQAKINSYLLARMRSYTEEYPYRAEIIRAMADIDYELKIDGKILKPKGELLSLTASEAVEKYGDPAIPLLAEGIAEDIEDLLVQHYGAGPLEIVTIEQTWSEDLAKYLSHIAPILMGIGFLALFIEFKTPGFGVFGVTGIALIAIVFFSNYVAGLAGWEGILVFIVGMLLIAIDLFFLPGTFVLMLIGGILALGSLVWSFADLWPTVEDDGSIGVVWNGQALIDAGAKVSVGIFACLVGLVIFWRFLPKTRLFSHMVLGGMPGTATPTGTPTPGTMAEKCMEGEIGEVIRVLHPVGEVEVSGTRFQARVTVGSIAKGEKVRLVRKEAFGWIVEPLK